MVRSGEGVNNTSVRAENRRRVAYLLYQRGALSKQAIARELGLSIPTVNLLVSQLKEEGLLTLQSGASTGGRIPEIAHFRYDSQYVFGLEVTDHHLRIVLIDLAGTPLFHAYHDLPFRKEQSYWIEAHEAEEPDACQYSRRGCGHTWRGAVGFASGGFCTYSGSALL